MWKTQREKEREREREKGDERNWTGRDSDCGGAAVSGGAGSVQFSGDTEAGKGLSIEPTSGTESAQGSWLSQAWKNVAVF